jgi:hypothetical protein
VYCDGSWRQGLLDMAIRVKEAMDGEGGQKGTIGWRGREGRAVSVVRAGGKSGYGKENGMEATVQLSEKSEDGLRKGDIGKTVNGITGLQKKW